MRIRPGFSLIEVSFALVTVAVSVMILMSTQATMFSRATRAYTSQRIHQAVQTSITNALADKRFSAPLTGDALDVVLPLEGIEGSATARVSVYPESKDAWRSDLRRVKVTYTTDEPYYREMSWMFMVYAPQRKQPSQPSA